MLFKFKKELMVLHDIVLNDAIIQRVNSTKFLGGFIDSTLSWHEHINYVITQNSKIIAFLKLANFYVSPLEKMFMYNNIYMPHLQGSAYSFNRKQIDKQQRKVLRILFNLSYRDPVIPTMQSHERFSCFMLYKYLALLFLYTLYT